MKLPDGSTYSGGIDDDFTHIYSTVSHIYFALSGWLGNQPAGPGQWKLANGNTQNGTNVSYLKSRENDAETYMAWVPTP